MPAGRQPRPTRSVARSKNIALAREALAAASVALSSNDTDSAMEYMAVAAESIRQSRFDSPSQFNGNSLIVSTNDSRACVAAGVIDSPEKANATAGISPLR